MVLDLDVVQISQNKVFLLTTKNRTETLTAQQKKYGDFHLKHNKNITFYTFSIIFLFAY